MSLVTTLLAPITQRSPMLTPLVTTTPAPSQQLDPIRVGPRLSKPCQVIGLAGSSKRWLAIRDEAAVGEHAVRADLDQLLGGDHHAEVQERALADGHARRPGAVIHTPGSSSTPSPTFSQPSRSASSTLPSTGQRANASRRMSSQWMLARFHGSELRSYQRHFWRHSLASPASLCPE